MSEAPNKPAVLGAGFLLLLQMGVPYSYAILRPAFQQQLGLDPVQVAMPYTAILVSYTAGMFVGGRWVDRWDPRAIGGVGAAVFGIGFAMAPLASSLPALLLTFGLAAGFGIGLGYMAAVKVANAHFPRRRGMATGIVVFGFGLSSALLAPLLGWAIRTFGLREAMAAFGVAFLVLGVACTRWFRLPSDLEDDATLPIGRFAIRGPIFALLWVAWAVVLAVGLGWLAQLPDVARSRGLPESLAGLFIGATAIANGLARPGLGTLADRVGRTAVLQGATLAAIGFLALPALSPELPAMWVAAIGLGVCFGAWLVNMAPLSGDLFGGAGMGGPYGLLFTSYGVGALLGPGLIANARQNGSDAAALAGSAAALLAGLAAFFVASHKIRRRVAEAG